LHGAAKTGCATIKGCSCFAERPQLRGAFFFVRCSSATQQGPHHSLRVLAFSDNGTSSRTTVSIADAPKLPRKHLLRIVRVSFVVFFRFVSVTLLEDVIHLRMREDLKAL
jgi:hypothetical protein